MCVCSGSPAPCHDLGDPRSHGHNGGHQGRSRVALSEEEPRHKGSLPRRRRITNRILIALAIVLVVVSTAFVVAYKKLEGNINAVSIGEALGNDRPDAVEVEGPKK